MSGQGPDTGSGTAGRDGPPPGGPLQSGRRPGLLPDQGAMVDEHGRPPGTPSRTGTGSGSPPSDPERVERAARRTEPGEADRR